MLESKRILMESFEEYCEELEEQNKKSQEEIAVLHERNDYLEQRNEYLEGVLEKIQDITGEYEDDYEDEEGDNKAYMDMYKNPFGISMRDVFKIGEAAKSMMSPAELTMYDMMKKSLGITEEDLK